MSDCRFGVSPVNYPDPDTLLPHGVIWKLGGPGETISSAISSVTDSESEW